MTSHLLLLANPQHICARRPAFLNRSSDGADPECPSPGDGHRLKLGQSGSSRLIFAAAIQKLSIPPESGYYKDDMRKKSSRRSYSKILNSPPAKAHEINSYLRTISLW